MLFFSYVKLSFTALATVFFLILLIPFKLVSSFIFFISICLIFINILLTPLIFKFKKPYHVFLYKILKSLIYMGFYKPNRKYWKLNYFNTFIISVLLFVISFLKCDIYYAIMSGICTGSIVTSFIYYFEFLKEKNIFCNKLKDALVKDIFLIDTQITNLDALSKHCFKNLSCTNLTRVMSNLEVNEKSLHTEIENTKIIIELQESNSYLIFQFVNFINNFKFLNNATKHIIIKEIINTELISIYTSLKSICSSLNDCIIEFLKISLKIKELFIKKFDNNTNDKNTAVDSGIDNNIQIVRERIIRLISSLKQYRENLSELLDNFNNIK